eukprot:TRINITY_DN31549_c0_g1_i1.p1 TRINITY_DN31549_c0_g1~~TRINITY_DN31549_c0_g1_i1.p1  ORF type:complete len:146 (-),score=12.16 TRINITY_DN31549_c0_g1_i1:13-450(-)
MFEDREARSVCYSSLNPIVNLKLTITLTKLSIVRGLSTRYNEKGGHYTLQRTFQWQEKVEKILPLPVHTQELDQTTETNEESTKENSEVEAILYSQVQEDDFTFNERWTKPLTTSSSKQCREKAGDGVGYVTQEKYVYPCKFVDV